METQTRQTIEEREQERVEQEKWEKHGNRYVNLTEIDRKERSIWKKLFGGRK